jgi:hypothetical protein
LLARSRLLAPRGAGEWVTCLAQPEYRLSKRRDKQQIGKNWTANVDTWG